MMAAEPAALPDDVLAEVLQRLAPHVLVASRQVCKAWRDAVDVRLRRHLLSHSVRGIFINYAGQDYSEFFSRPSTGPAICGALDFLPCDGVKVADHCNGLLLCGDGEREYVVKPATRRWARLPRCPRPRKRGFGQSAYLAFDPAVSPHYEVFLIPRLPRAGQSDDDAFLQSEWPPASYALYAFSSAAHRWYERTFRREGEAAGIVAHMDSDPWYDPYHAVYWRSTLYIHCHHGYLTRMCLSNHTYRVIRLPGADGLRGYGKHHLGRSLRGVYYAKNNCWHKLQIWHLDEPRDQTERVLKHDIDLETFARKFHARVDCAQHMGRQWILQDVNYRKILEEYYPDGHGNYEAPVEEKYDWNSDEDNVLDIEDAAEGGYSGGCYHFLGFHPYKEIVYLSLSIGRGVAYDWNSSKFQDLGRLDPKCPDEMEEGTDTSFTYTLVGWSSFLETNWSLN